MKKKKQSLLWEISFADHSNQSYVFGTMHVKSQKVFSAFDQIASYIDLCDSFCLEIDMSLSQDPDMGSRMMLESHEPLSTLIPEKDFVRLGKILRHLQGPDILQLQYLRPMNLISLLSSLIMKEDVDTILDTSLYQYAESQGKHTFGIETKEEHLAILDSMTLDLQVKQLKEIIRQFSSFKKTHHKMMDHYINGRIDRLYHHGKKSLGPWRKILLKDRNYKMAQRLNALSAKESVFCAIGAGHLAGKFGVLRLMKLHGAKIRPVRLDFQ